MVVVVAVVGPLLVRGLGNGQVAVVTDSRVDELLVV